ncbi:MAG: 50S ribosomal protein L13 [Candidatus Omnitrophota bacterium]
MKTTYVRNEDVKRKWHLVDAKDKILGRLATKIATVLMGKHRATFSPHVDSGDGVVVINCEKIKVTGNKLKAKEYKRFSGYPSGLKIETLETVLKKRPQDVLKHAVDGMLPKNKLGRKMIKRLKLCVGDKHPHIAQNPKELKI